MYIPINHIAHSYSNGPGYRLVIWVQGCTMHCPGCFNPSIQDMSFTNRMSVSRLVNIINADKTIEGITFSGGEPMLYAEALYKVMCKIRKGLTRIIYTGLTFEELYEDEMKQKLFTKTDLIIAGRYNQQLCHPYLGKKFIRSTNRIDINYFNVGTRIEYLVGKNNIIKTGIF